MELNENSNTEESYSKLNVEKTFQNFYRVFNVENKQDLINYLTEINIDTQQVCTKSLDKGKNFKIKFL